MDFSAPMIHGLPMLARNPKVWAKATLTHFQAFVHPQTLERYLVANYDTLKEMLAHRVDIGPSEFYESLEQGGLLTRVLPKIVTQQVFGRFGTSFNAWGLVARVEFWKAMHRTAERANALPELGELINHMTGTLSTRGLGVSPTQRAGESGVLFYSPRYTRAAGALILDMAGFCKPKPEPLAAGASEEERAAAEEEADRVYQASRWKAGEALRTLASLAMGGLALHIAVSKLLGQEPNLDPEQGKFMTVKVGDAHVGPGSIWTSLVRLMGEIYETATENPEGFVSLSGSANPFLRWFRSRIAPAPALAWDLATKRTWLGEPLETPTQVLAHVGSRLLPFWLEEYLMQEENPGWEGLPGQLAGLRVWGLSPWERQHELEEELAQEVYGQTWTELSRAKQEGLRGAYPLLQKRTERAREVGVQRGYESSIFWQEVEQQRKPMETEIEQLNAAMKSGQLTGNEYRERLQAQEMLMAMVPKQLKATARYKDLPITEQERWEAQGKKGAPPEPENLTDLFMDAYYGVPDAVRDPDTGLVDAGDVVRRREEVKRYYPPEVVAEAMEYINRRRNPEYVQALELYRQYMAIPQYIGLTDEQADMANTAIRKHRSLRRANPYIDSEVTWAVYAQQDPEGTYYGRMAAKLRNPERRYFWAMHPLLSRYFGDVSGEELEMLGEYASMGTTPGFSPVGMWAQAMGQPSFAQSPIQMWARAGLG